MIDFIPEQIIDELEARDIYGDVSGTGNKYMICCPYHNDSTPSFQITLEADNSGEDNGLFYCFGCEARGNFIELVAFLDGITTKESYRLLGGTVGENDLEVLEKKFYRMLKSSNRKEQKTEYRLVNIQQYKSLEVPYGKYFKFLLNRKLSSQSIENFDLRVAKHKDYKNRVWFPYYNLDGEIVTAKARTVNKNQKDYKMLHLKKTFSKGCLYGLPQLKEKFSDIEYCVLVEGEIDTIYLQQNDVPALGLGNMSLSHKQGLELITNFEYCFLSLDGDTRDTELKRKIVRKLFKRIEEIMPVKIINLPDGKDPNDLFKYEIKKLYSNSKF